MIGRSKYDWNIFHWGVRRAPGDPLWACGVQIMKIMQMMQIIERMQITEIIELTQLRRVLNRCGG